MRAQILFKEINEILKTFKIRQAPGSDKLHMELFKYASTTAKSRFLNIYAGSYIKYLTGKKQ
jgi:hypothetical protein